jgi:hypothetical protein
MNRRVQPLARAASAATETEILLDNKRLMARARRRLRARRPIERALEQIAVDFYEEDAWALRVPDLRIACALGAVSGVIAAAVVPYLLAIDPGHFGQFSVSPETIAIGKGLQVALVTTLCAFLGLRMAIPVSLKPLELRGSVSSKRFWSMRWQTAECLLMALLAGAASAALTATITSDPFSLLVLQDGALSFSKAGGALVAALDTALFGEITLRLFGVTLIAWSISRFTDVVTAPIYWLAIVFVAGGTGLVEVATVVVDTNLAISHAFRIWLATALAGTLFGWLYWKRGLEVAALAHLAYELARYAAAPFLRGG